MGIMNKLTAILAVFFMGVGMFTCSTTMSHREIKQNEILSMIKHMDATVVSIVIITPGTVRPYKRLGTGVIIKRNRGERTEILTARHLFDDSDNIENIFWTSEELSGANHKPEIFNPVNKIVLSKTTDLALLYSMNKEFENGEYAKVSKRPNYIGQEIALLGNSGDHNGVMSFIYKTGEVSSFPYFNPRLKGIIIESMLHILPGDSGSPVFDKNTNEVVGITVAMQYTYKQNPYNGQPDIVPAQSVIISQEEIDVFIKSTNKCLRERGDKCLQGASNYLEQQTME